MANFLAIFQLFVQLLPLLTQAVTAIEAAMPASGQGAQKLAMVKATLQSAYQSAGTMTVTFEQLWPVLNAAVASLVAMKNATGAFSTSTSTSAAPR